MCVRHVCIYPRPPEPEVEAFEELIQTAVSCCWEYPRLRE